MSDARPEVDRDETMTQGERDPFDVLAEEFAGRCRAGEAPSIAGYEARHPEHAEKIRRLLPAVAMMEQLKRGSPPAPSEMDPPLPDRLGEFRIVRELGRGGMGVVYEAVQESLGRHVALKVIHRVHLDAKRRQRFRREAQAIAQLHHTNIVPIFAVGEHDGVPYFAMQYIEGSGLDASLGTWRREGSPRGESRWRFAARVGMQAAEALHHAHEQGVLHRDIKPANLLIDEHRAVWITDFGLAKLSGSEDLTASGDVIGTLRYLAPEALRGEGDRRGDVYSLGLTLYELLTLSPPFGGLTPSELLRHVSEGRPTRPRRLDPAIPRDLETIVLKAIAREPEHRYSTAGALADDLRRFLEDRPIRARRTGPIERAWRWSRRNRMVAALLATAAGSLILAAAVGWVGYASTRRALDRADRNVALSLEVFGELFERLSGPESLPPPPISRDGGRRRSPFGPDSGPPPIGRLGPPPFGEFEGPGPPPRFGPFEAGPRPMDEPGGGGPARRASEGEDLELLRSVLTFYDRFAQQNATNPRLRREAAWASARVGALSQRLGRDDEAQAAYDRAIAMFEALVAQYPDVPAYRFKLVETYNMADPWTADPSSLERLARQLRRAEALIDRLVAETPGNEGYGRARLHVLVKLGAVLQRDERADDAEKLYRRSIDLAGELIRRFPEFNALRLDRATVRETLAILALDRDREDEARALLDEAAGELESLAKGRRIPPPLRDRFESLAGAYERLGDADRANAMARRAEQVGMGPHRGHRDPFGPGDGPP